jgi:hypothetical protein
MSQIGAFGVFLAGVGILLLGVGVLWFVSIYDEKNKKK